MLKFWPQMHHWNPPALEPVAHRSSISFQSPNTNKDNDNNHTNRNDTNISDSKSAIFINDYFEMILRPLVCSSIGDSIKSLWSFESSLHSRKDIPDTDVDYSNITTFGLGKVTGPPSRVHWKVRELFLFFFL